MYEKNGSMWCIEGILSKLYHSKLNFIITLDNLRIGGHVTWLPQKNIGFDYQRFYDLSREDIKNTKSTFEDPGYHTTIQSQEFLAEETIKKLTISFNLFNGIV
jgi:hypothetical protein